MEEHSGQPGMDLQTLVDCLCKIKRRRFISLGRKAIQRQLPWLASPCRAAHSSSSCLLSSCIFNDDEKPSEKVALHIGRNSNNSSWNDQAPECLNSRGGNFPVLLLELEHRLQQLLFKELTACMISQKSRSTEKLFPLLYWAAVKISLPTQQDEILKDEIHQAKQIQNKILPEKNKDKLVNSRGEKNYLCNKAANQRRDYSSNLPTHEGIFKGE